MRERPGAWTAFRARLRNEVDAGVVEAFRRAGAAVYDLADEVDDRRRLLCLAGHSPWQFPLQFQTEALCTWIAFVFQMCGDRLLLEDYADEPDTVGFLPPETHRVAENFYARVHPWLVAARVARASEEYRVHHDAPVTFGEWDPVPSSPVHLRTMAHIVDVLAARLAEEVAWYAHHEKRSHQRTYDHMRRLLADAAAREEYADVLLEDMPAPVLETVHDNLNHALRTLFLLGQYVAFPGLLRNALDEAR